MMSQRPYIHQQLRYTYNQIFSSSVSPKMIQTVFSLPSIYNNYAGAHPFTNGFAFDAFSNHSWKTRQKIQNFLISNNQFLNLNYMPF